MASNRLAREQGIAGMESMDVPLHKVISGEQQLGLAAGSTWSNCSVGKLSLETGSNFLWSADARASVRTSRTGRLGFCYCLELHVRRNTFPLLICMTGLLGTTPSSG